MLLAVQSSSNVSIEWTVSVAVPTCTLNLEFDRSLSPAESSDSTAGYCAWLEPHFSHTYFDAGFMPFMYAPDDVDSVLQ